MKVDVLVPTDLSEITLDKFVRLLDSEDKNQGSVFHMQKTVEIICDIDLKSVATIKYADVQNIYNHVQNLFKVEPEFKPRFTFEGVDYGFIPILDDISFGEYIDIDQNMTSWKTMHKAMSVLYRPITHSKEERYDIEKYNSNQDSQRLKHMPADVAIGANFFLFNLGMELLETILNCSSKERGMSMEEKHSLLTNGVGFKASMDSLKAMLQKSNILLN